MYGYRTRQSMTTYYRMLTLHPAAAQRQTWVSKYGHHYTLLTFTSTTAICTLPIHQNIFLQYILTTLDVEKKAQCSQHTYNLTGYDI